MMWSGCPHHEGAPGMSSTATKAAISGHLQVVAEKLMPLKNNWAVAFTVYDNFAFYSTEVGVYLYSCAFARMAHTHTCTNTHRTLLCTHMRTPTLMRTCMRLAGSAAPALGRAPAAKLPI